MLPLISLKRLKYHVLFKEFESKLGLVSFGTRGDSRSHFNMASAMAIFAHSANLSSSEWSFTTLSIDFANGRPCRRRSAAQNYAVLSSPMLPPFVVRRCVNVIRAFVRFSFFSVSEVFPGVSSLHILPISWSPVGKPRVSTFAPAPITNIVFLGDCISKSASDQRLGVVWIGETNNLKNLKLAVA